MELCRAFVGQRIDLLRCNISLVRQLCIDDTISGSRLSSNPTWSDVREAIDSMDGARRSQVGLLIDDEHFLIIGGGPQGYVVSYQAGAEVFSLMTSAGEPDTAQGVVCGQGADFPSDEVVSVEDVYDAARVFHTIGQKSETAQWRQY